MRYINLFAAFLLLSALSCRTIPAGSEGEEKSSAPADTSGSEEKTEEMKIIERARQMLSKDQYSSAQQTLAPLLNSDTPPERALQLSNKINELRAEEAREKARKKIEDTTMDEVHERMKLPKNYGKTETITPSTRAVPETLPGKMHKLLEEEISMNVQEAGVKELVFTLSEIQDLNVVADDSLKASQKLNISVKNVPLKDLLKYISKNMGLDFHIGDNVIWISKAGKEKQWQSNELKTKIYPLQSGFIPHLENQKIEGFESAMPSKKDYVMDLKDALKTFTSEGPEGSTYKIYKDRNLLIARNTPENLRLIEKIVKNLDRAPRQVLIEARFITINREDLFSLGLNLENILVPASGTKAPFREFFPIEPPDDADSKAMKTTTTKKDGNGNIKEITTQLYENIPESLGEKRLDAVGNLPGQLSVSGILGNVTYKAILDAIEEKTSSQTLSAPRVTVMNNRTAFIHQGNTRYYFEEYELSSVDEGDAGIRTQVTPSGKPKQLDLGFKLQVKASIGNNGDTVLLALKPSISNFEGFDTFSNDQIQLPLVRTNTVATTVGVESGETVVLGGTISNTVNEIKKRIPYISGIPFLGKLFQYTSSKEIPEHLLIFVTARALGRSGKFQETVAGTSEAD